MYFKEEFLKIKTNIDAATNDDINKYSDNFQDLINNGININNQNSKQETLLHLAVRSGNIKITRLLLESDAVNQILKMNMVIHPYI